MNTIKISSLALLILVMASVNLSAGDKYYVPSWNMPQGTVATPMNKAHVTKVDYTPHLIVNYDKQHIPWFESTLKPQNLRREGQGDFLVEIGKFLSGLFGR